MKLSVCFSRSYLNTKKIAEIHIFGEGKAERNDLSLPKAIQIGHIKLVFPKWSFNCDYNYQKMKVQMQFL